MIAILFLIVTTMFAQMFAD